MINYIGMAVEDFEFIRGNMIRRPFNIDAPFEYKILMQHDELESHFSDKESEFGDENKNYFVCRIFCTNLDDGILEMKKQIDRYPYLELLYALAVDGKGFDYDSLTFPYGNAIYIALYQPKKP